MFIGVNMCRYVPSTDVDVGCGARQSDSPVQRARLPEKSTETIRLPDESVDSDVDGLDQKRSRQVRKEAGWNIEKVIVGICRV